MVAIPAARAEIRLVKRGPGGALLVAAGFALAIGLALSAQVISQARPPNGPAVQEVEPAPAGPRGVGRQLDDAEGG